MDARAPGVDHAALAAQAAAEMTGTYAQGFRVQLQGATLVVNVPRFPDNTLILGMLVAVASEARKHGVGVTFDVQGPFNYGQRYAFRFGGPASNV